MLSKEANQFIIELKMYLMSKGKNDQEIQSVIDELSDHLLEAEAAGKTVKDITGPSPRAYMKSIGQEMNTDKRELLILIPMTTLLIMAYICFTPALSGDFSLSKIGVIGAISTAVLAFLLYGFLLLRVFPKMFDSKWFHVLTVIVSIIITAFFVVVFFFDKNPFFVATPMQNNIIVVACIVTFIVWAMYSKTWITILIPVFMSFGPVVDRFIPEHINKDPKFITFAIIFVVLAFIIASYFIYKNAKKNSII